MNEVNADGILIPLEGPFEVIEVGGVLTYDPNNPLQPRDNGQIEVPEAPVIDTTTSVMTADDTAELHWTPNLNGPAANGWEVWRDGVFLDDMLPTILTYTDSTVPVDGLTHQFQIRAQGSIGVGPFATIPLLWGGTPTPKPAAPTSFRYSNLQSTSVTLAWNMASTTGIDEYRIRYGSGTLLRQGIAGDTLATSLTGLTSGTTYSGVYAVSVDSAGVESLPSNTVSFTTPGVTVVQHDIVMGVPTNDEYDALFFQQWDGIRVYNLAELEPDYILASPRVVGLTGNTPGFPTGGSATATLLRNALEDFYYPNGVQSTARQNVEIHFATDNETDRSYTTGSLPTNYVNTVALCSAVTRDTRYPNASMWVDMTQHQIDINGAGPRFKVIAQYLDGFACSMYPPGRRVTNTKLQNGDTLGPFYNPYSDYCDYVFAALADWRQSGGPGGTSLAGQLDQFSTWEFGIPIDNALSTGEPRTTGTDPSDLSVRPRYVAGGRDGYGNNWTGFLQYVYNKCDQMGVRMRLQLYWNQQSDADIPNRLIHDRQPRANPDTEHAWRNWTPGSRLLDV